MYLKMVSLRNQLVNTVCLRCCHNLLVFIVIQDRRRKQELRAETELRMTGKAGRKERKVGKWVRDGGVAPTQRESLRFWMCVCARVCVCPIEWYVYKSASQAVCVLQGRCFLQCNLSLWWNVWTTSDSTLLEPPTHSISHCKQPLDCDR